VIVALVGHLEPASDNFATNLARFAMNPLFRGIRLNGNAIVEGVTRPVFLQDLERVADAGLMMDAIGSATMIPALQLLTRRIPKLRIAIDHMPGEPTGWQNSRAALLELAKQPQVYCKVSGVLKRVDGKVSEDPSAYKPALDEVWDAFGPDRVMYGSNWPVSDHLSSYGTVLSVMQRYLSTRTVIDADKFFRINSRTCYRWVDHG
jgi:predicted TIM-barrel fold metal-dependent hydrolase